MKKYNNFRWGKNKFQRWNTLLLVLSLLGITESLQAQTTVITPCSCTSFSIIGETNGEISLDEYIDIHGPLNPERCYLVKGTLVIDVIPETQWVNLRIKMEEKAMIRVEESFSIDSCYLSGCGDMWKGIETVGQTYFHSYNSFIEDANIGVKLGGLAGFVCKWTHFINNYIGVATADPFTTDTEDKVIHRGEIMGCHFYTSTTLPDPYPGHYYYPSWPNTPAHIPYNKGFAAIYLSKTVGLNIGYFNAEDPDRNKIHDMRNGIIMRIRTVSNISGTDFYNFEGSIKSTAISSFLNTNQHAIDMMNSVSDIQDNTIDNLMYGIYGYECVNDKIYKNEITLSSPSPDAGYTRGITLIRPQKANIVQNIINEGMRGISIEDVVNDFLIEQNDLNTSYFYLGVNLRIFIRNAWMNPADGIIKNNDLIVDDALSSVGIYSANSNLLTLEDNEIDFLNDEDHQTRGILGVGTTRSYIAGNDVFRSVEDVQLGNNGIQYENSSFNTLFCNTMENFWLDMNLIAANTRTDIESNTKNEGEFGFGLWGPSMIGTQYHHGNKWPATFGDFGAFLFSGGIQEAEVSRFFVDEMEDGDFMPNPIGPIEVESDVWFKDQHTEPPTFTCFSGPPPIADPDTLSKLIRTELSYDQFNDEMTWIVKADVFDMILAEPGLTSNAVLDSFYNAEENSPLGKLVAWQKGLASRFGEERTLKALTLDTIMILSGNIAYVDSILALSPNDSLTWIAARVLKADKLEAEIAELHSYLVDEENDSQDMYEIIEDDLDNLTTTNGLEAYLKEALLFKAQYLEGSSFSAGDSTALADLALLCPWEGGRAMSTGQELYSTINNQLIFTTLENCPSVPSGSMMTSTDPFDRNDKKLAVNPNPVADYVKIQCVDKMLKLSMWNTDLKSVYESTPMDQQWTVQMDHMPTGTYILSATTAFGQYYKRIIHVK